MSNHPPRQATTPPQIKTILFDFMGTCLDWHTSITSSLPNSIPQDIRSTLSSSWRQAYFASNRSRLASGLPPEPIDETHTQTLSTLLSTDPRFMPYANHFTPATVQEYVAAWHSQKAWSDVRPALETLKARGYELVIHANGTTRLQLDLLRSSGLGDLFMLPVSSQMLGVYKPGARAYERVLEWVGRQEEEVLMVAAHREDVDGARAAGIRGVYVWRETEGEDREQTKKEFARRDEGAETLWIEGMESLVKAVEGSNGNRE